ARTINALGEVRWGSLAELSRLNFRHRIVGRTLHVQPMATRIDVTIPDGVEEIHIDTGGGAPWDVVDSDIMGGRLEDKPFTVPVSGGNRCSLQMRHPEPIVGEAPRPRSTQAKLIARRILTEARDRLCVS